jgi:hypothetical protein
MDGLRKCIYSGQCFTKIREANCEEDSDTIDLTETPPRYTLESTSKGQLNRVMIQCITVLTMLQQVLGFRSKFPNTLTSFSVSSDR